MDLPDFDGLYQFTGRACLVSTDGFVRALITGVMGAPMVLIEGRGTNSSNSVSIGGDIFTRDQWTDFHTYGVLALPFEGFTNQSTYRDRVSKCSKCDGLGVREYLGLGVWKGKEMIECEVCSGSGKVAS